MVYKMEQMNNMQKILCSKLGDSIVQQAEKYFNAKKSADIIIFNRENCEFEYRRLIGDNAPKLLISVKF